MIEFVHGRVDYISPEYIIIDTGGIGYQVFCPNPFVYQKNENEQIKIFTYHYVREDASTLFGFKTRDERWLFEKLLNVSGIGPKGGLAILATGEVQHVVQAIEDENEKYLTKFPGVGKKTARQIILDLKGKLGDLMPDLFQPGEETAANQKELHPELDEAMAALEALGYAGREIKKVIPKLENERLTTEEYIKKALQLMLNSGR
ncbi:Holliday junction branch migration protein RuvA [Bacillus marinisedimentorum]|uniref:Holliday junction branch migration protein RuvA n=1 Tax=Bacillus marinisedimentorum TaxID=1821260 RepID=UPI0008729494|nr:Holliday junction branch migration protein RuvA [Bacillus marinisedimentorum]